MIDDVRYTAASPLLIAHPLPDPPGTTTTATDDHDHDSTAAATPACLNTAPPSATQHHTRATECAHARRCSSATTCPTHAVRVRARGAVAQRTPSNDRHSSSERRPPSQPPPPSCPQGGASAHFQESARSRDGALSTTARRASCLRGAGVRCLGAPRGWMGWVGRRRMQRNGGASSLAGGTGAVGWCC